MTALDANTGRTPTTAAYVMYTSGTTGAPKGLLVPHRAVVRLVFGSEFAELGPGTRILQTGAIGFDTATFELWGALLRGGCLVLVPEETVLDAPALGTTITNARDHHDVADRSTVPPVRRPGRHDLPAAA